MFAVVAVLSMFLVVVGLHEIGHALVARRFGVKIERIAIGFGRPIYRVKDQRGIEWVIGIWPLGGYVQLLNTRIQTVPNVQYQHYFDKKSAGIRCLILLAGGCFNFLAAWFAITIVMMVGYSQNPAVVSKVIPQSLAASAGLNAGDRLLSINLQEINSWQEAGMKLMTELGHAKVKLEVINTKQQIKKIDINLSSQNFKKQKGSFFTRLGIKPKIDNSSMQWVGPQPFYSAFSKALAKAGSFCIFYILMIKQVVTGQIPISMLLGPLGLFAVSIDSFIQGFSQFMLFLAMLSVAVGIVNYLPIPGLDGGSIVYVVLEKIRGKPLSIAMEILLYRFAMIAFFILMVQLVLNDVGRYLTN